MATKQGNDRLAVMIDADNAQASLVQELLAEVSRYGTATIKRAYGDWTTPNLTQWKGVLHANAVQPMQQFRYTTGKNATDSALIIDAMDVLHSGHVDGFCLVSSDSDFTRLATRIREAGLAVYGFGERKTPAPFVAACDKFVYTEILREKPEEIAKAVDPKAGGDGAIKPEPVPELPKLKPMVLKALEVTARDDGWSTLSALGGQLTRNHPSFDSRNYHEAKLGDLMRKQPYLETKEVPAGEAGTHINLYVRRKVVQGPKAS
ncbi:MAG: NYN domain-containing protein [Hydrogenophaga sp.]|uniref:NYN domain-containing protein n=1 Tax=Hydrogenophaga sp. TaxID=1904254 RepID=UPI002765D77A|nr:NYN domain-containing protein [Hydrogenophaga sp.]MDZ4358723.1 NYN domain-containing protein [Variovorax sp.]